jgi:hypothetical protein
VAGQRWDDFGWGYACPELDRQSCPGLLRQLQALTGSLDQWRQAALKGKTFDPGRSDNSNTQFALLALWTARRHRVPIDRVVERVQKRFLTTQQGSGPDPTGHNLNLDGAWFYTPQDGMTSNQWPSMTCSGLLGLAMAHGLTEKAGKPLKDPAIRRGLAMLGREINRPGDLRPLDLYFLWSLERVGVLFKLAKIENKDWYTWGYKRLLATQAAADGSWQGSTYYGTNPLLDTCFALLFLKQANLAADLTSKLQMLEGRP